MTLESEVKPMPPETGEDAVDWKVCGVLMFAGLLASLAVVPYLIEIMRATGKEVVAWKMTVSTVSDHVVLLAIAICIGLMLGPKVNLGTPLLNAALSGKPGWARQSRSSLMVALVAGIGVEIVLSAADPWLEKLMPPWPEEARKAEQVAETMAAWKPLLASFSAGVTEELLFRFGFMTLLVWLGAKISRHQTPGSFAYWMANGLAAILFGLAHLTNVVELGISMTAGTILYVTLTNGSVGLVFGWLYWRHGLEAAVLAHIVADVVLKVAVPMIHSSFATEAFAIA